MHFDPGADCAIPAGAAATGRGLHGASIVQGQIERGWLRKPLNRQKTSPAEARGVRNEESRLNCRHAAPDPDRKAQQIRERVKGRR
ncbi:uncharacterized protein PG986_000960 [Apiospora aurea]|uniref:Uncharacterized protein n=1 Tax=Apiospora aurea TaxID=335848 RepID=A0ABR1QVK9_9PEZI